ncbi:MAG: nicotinate (nicotinamide) nucleotide adenylyltransferase [Rhodothermales bacterium]
MNIGLFGGSFNPPHLGHLIVAETVRDQFGLDQVWWIPAFNPPHKAGDALASPRHRFEMTRRATEDNPGFDVSDIEIRREGTSYTVDTIRTLQEAHPAYAFSLLIGGDSLRAFGTWHHPDEIIARVPLIVYRRSGEERLEIEPGPAGRVRFAEAPLLDISGTEIRARLRARRSIRYFVPDSVRTYIEQHGLYL